MPQEQKQKLVAYLIDVVEGGYANLEGDKGGETMYGISSRWFPKAFALAASGEWERADVESFYLREFAGKIVLFDQLMAVDPAVASLLFMGKVHGNGIKDYTTVIQRSLVGMGKLSDSDVDGLWGPQTATTYLNLSNTEREEVMADIVASRPLLIASRQSAVGIHPTGIANRITRELSFAREVQKREETPRSLVPSDRESYWVSAEHQGAEFSIKIG